MFTDGYNEALDEKSAVYSGKVEHNDWFRLSTSIEAISMDTNRTGTLHKDSIISFDCFTMRNDELYAVVSDICICSAIGYPLYTAEETLLVCASDLETNAVKDNDLRDFCEQKDNEMQHIRFATSPKHLALKIATGIACLISILCLGIITFVVFAPNTRTAVMFIIGTAFLAGVSYFLYQLIDDKESDSLDKKAEAFKQTVLPRIPHDCIQDATKR